MSSESKRTVFGAILHPLVQRRPVRRIDRRDRDASDLSEDLAQILLDTSEFNWARINPAIFGTLFERGLDPESRAPLGAYYTDPDNIMRVIEPVVLRPLRTEFDALKADLTSESDRGGAAGRLRGQRAFRSRG